MSPKSGPTSGDALGPQIPFSIGYYPGPPILCTIRGSDFGLGGTVNFAVAGFLSTAGPAAQVVSWNHTVVQFYMPPGPVPTLSGDGSVGLNVVPTVAGQTPADWNGAYPPALFSYDPPTLLAVGRADRAPVQCAPISSCYSSANGTTFCALVPAQCYDTAGRYPVQLVGESFGRDLATVVVGGALCDATGANQTDYSLTCLMPPGIGEAVPVTVFAGGRASNTLLFSYDPPIIQSIVPSTPDANGASITLQVSCGHLST